RFRRPDHWRQRGRRTTVTRAILMAPEDQSGGNGPHFSTASIARRRRDGRCRGACFRSGVGFCRQRGRRVVFWEFRVCDGVFVRSLVWTAGERRHFRYPADYPDRATVLDVCRLRGLAAWRRLFGFLGRDRVFTCVHSLPECIRYGAADRARRLDVEL